MLAAAAAARAAKVGRVPPASTRHARLARNPVPTPLEQQSCTQLYFCPALTHSFAGGGGGQGGGGGSVTICVNGVCVEAQGGKGGQGRVIHQPSIAAGSVVCCPEHGERGCTPASTFQAPAMLQALTPALPSALQAAAVAVAAAHLALGLRAAAEVGIEWRTCHACRRLAYARGHGLCWRETDLAPTSGGSLVPYCSVACMLRAPCFKPGWPRYQRACMLRSTHSFFVTAGAGGAGGDAVGPGAQGGAGGTGGLA